MNVAEIRERAFAAQAVDSTGEGMQSVPILLAKLESNIAATRQEGVQQLAYLADSLDVEQVYDCLNVCLGPPHSRAAIATRDTTREAGLRDYHCV